MNVWTALLIFLIVFFVAGGHFYSGGIYRGYGWSTGTILLLVLIVIFIAQRGG